MSLHKRPSGYWAYDFTFKGRRFQGSTKVKNINLARQIETKIRNDAALENVGIAPPKITPLFKDFMDGAFLTHIRKHAKSSRTVRFYEFHTTRLLKHAKFAGLRLNQIDEEAISGYAPTGSIATINCDLRTLRRALRLAQRWRLIREVRVHTLPGERQRKFVLTAEMEKRYLELAPYPVKQAAILMLDLGLRPEEVVTLRKVDTTDTSVTISKGKTANSTRSLPQTDRTRATIDLLKALWPDSPWLFPGRKGKHLRRGSLDNLHAKIRRDHDFPADFVLYTFRHSFGTRMDESGASPFEIKSAMGHYSIVVTQRYVHVTGDHLRRAMAQKEMRDKIVRGEVEIHEDTPEKSKTP